MDTLNIIFNLLCQNKHPQKQSTDIYEHLPTLYKYAKECDSIFETGVRGCVSSFAFLKGLVENNSTNKKRLFMNDITTCDISDLLLVGSNFKDKIDITYEWKNNLLLDINEKYDITFIDTWHVYGQLKRELDKFSKITNKYIIMHDTTVDEIYGETIRCGMNAIQQSMDSGFPLHEINKGLGPALVEFLLQNPNWKIRERFTNNNGLTILEKQN